jgi:hypothetical protein
MSKLETDPKFETRNRREQGLLAPCAASRLRVCVIWGSSFEFVSNFGFRASDLED